MSLVELGSVRVTNVHAGYGDVHINEVVAPDGLVHRSFDSEAMVHKGTTARFIPCHRRWIYQFDYHVVNNVPNCLRCIVFVPTV